MSRVFDSLVYQEPQSFLTDPVSQARLAAQMPWWGWVFVGLGLLMAGLMMWYLWPRRPKPRPDLPRDPQGRLIPPWKWQDLGVGPGRHTPRGT